MVGNLCTMLNPEGGGSCNASEKRLTERAVTTYFETWGMSN